MGTLQQDMQQRGWFLKPSVLEQLREAATTDDVHNAALHLDIRKQGTGALPDNLESLSGSRVQGPVIVQLLHVRDAASPSQALHHNNQPLLCAQVTDGRVMARLLALDAKQHSLTLTHPPGTKLRLCGAPACYGVILVNDGCMEVLGGRVEALAAAWEAQRKYTFHARTKLASGWNFGPEFRMFSSDSQGEHSRLSVVTATGDHPKPPQPPSTSDSAHHQSSRRAGRRAGEADPPASHTPAARPRNSAGSTRGRGPGDAAVAGSEANNQPAHKTQPQESSNSRAATAGVQAAVRTDNTTAVRTILQERFGGAVAPSDAAGGRRQRGGRRGRRHRSPEDSGLFVSLDQWQAEKRAASGSGTHTQVQSDAEYARALQDQFDAQLALDDTRGFVQRQDNSGRDDGRDHRGGRFAGGGPHYSRGRRRGHGRGRGCGGL